MTKKVGWESGKIQALQSTQYPITNVWLYNIAIYPNTNTYPKMGKVLYTSNTLHISKVKKDMAFDGTRVIMGAISIVIGLVLLPLVATFKETAASETAVSNVSGLTSVLDLILYGFTFGLVGIGIGMIYLGFQK